jgi:hypothetical protein
MVVKIRILAISVVVAGTFASVACSFGPDAYNGPGPCPGTAPPDGVQTDSECHDYSDAGDTDAGDASMGGGDTAGSPGAAGTAGTAGAAGTAGTGTAGSGIAGGGGSGG